MKANIKLLCPSLSLSLCFALTLAFTLSAPAHAAGASDINLETEDIINESDAAVADTKDFKQHTSKEKSQATQRLEGANKTLKAAAAKRQKAIDEMHASEAEIARLNAEQAKTKADAARLDGENAQTEKTIKDNRAKIERLKVELAAIKQMRTEKAQKYLEIASERDKTMGELKTIEDERTQADADLQQAKAQEKAAADQVTKLKQEYTQKKVKLEAYVAGLKERYRHAVEAQTKANTEKAEMERNNLKLEAQAKAGEAEVAKAENPQSEPDTAEAPPSNATTGELKTEVPAPSEAQPVASAALAAPPAADRTPTSSAALTFTRKCRVFDGPVRGANVVAVQAMGMSVAKSNEGKEWVSFLLQDGRKAFAAKNCFR